MTTYRHPTLGEWKTGDDPVITYAVNGGNGVKVITASYSGEGLTMIGLIRICLLGLGYYIFRGRAMIYGRYIQGKTS